LPRYLPRAFREAVYTRPHKLQFRSVAQLVALHTNSLCTTLVRLANSFVPNRFQILSFMLKLGIFFAIKGNVAQTRSLARPREASRVKRNTVRYVKRYMITSVKARCVITEYGDGLNMCMLRSFAKCVAQREARAV
jgi:hypothetical protein